jgi:hypothetical protein
LARASAAGDFAALQAQIDRNPEHASEYVRRALDAPPDPARAAELDIMAVRLAKRLRLSGKPAPALELAVAGRRRTAGYRMEEALAAFALGKDDEAAAVAAEDEQVAAIVGPLLSAARGDTPSLPPARSKAAPPLRALHAAARAVAHAVRGEPARGRAVLRRMDRSLQKQVFAREFSAAIDIADPKRTIEGIAELSASPIARASGNLRHAIIAEASTQGSDEVVKALRKSFPDATREELRLAMMPGLRARLLAATSPAAAADVLRDLDPVSFPAPDRAAAALYKGYGLLNVDPEAASRSFDQAVDLGGDLVEALRGKLLAAHAAAAGSPRTCAQRAIREVAAAADRLGRALGHDARGKPLAAAAETMAAEAWLGARDARSVEASLARARTLGAGGPELDILEAKGLALRDRAAALARIDTLLARDRANVEVWRLKIELAARPGDGRAAEALVLDAAEATKDPELVEEARRIRSERGEIAPFEGFVPGAVSAGALAKELARLAAEEDERVSLTSAEKHDRTRDEGRARMRACRDALSPASRVAFDAAAIAIAAKRSEHAAARQRLGEAIAAWRASPHDLCRITAVAILVELEEDLPKEVRLLAGDAPALIAVAKALIAAGEGQRAEKLLPRAAAELSRDDLEKLRRLAKDACFREVEIPGVPDPEEAARELDIALAPEFSILGFLRAVDEEDAFYEDVLEFDLPIPADFPIPDDVPPHMLLKLMLSSIGAPPGALDWLPRPLRKQAEREIAKIVQRPPTPRSVARVIELFEEMGIRPPKASSSRPRKAR